MTTFLKTGKKEQSVSLEETEPSSSSSSVAMGATPLAKVVRQGTGADPSKPLARKAKEIRTERKKLKQQQTGTETPMTTPTPTSSSKDRKSLEAHLEELHSLKDPAHKLTVRLVQLCPPAIELLDTLQESHRLYQKYQMAVHKDPSTKCSFENFKQFLLESPLVPEPHPPEWECGYGTYHQQYILDGKLIMVGVVDILPNCISSKYLYYDTNYEFLRLGVFSALNELALVRRLHRINPSLRYYCMGYYLHSCQKMKYKGDYTPSYLLCPVTNQYVPIESCRPKLDLNKYSRFDEQACPSLSGEADSTLVLYHNEAIPFGVLKATKEKESDTFEEKVNEYSKLVGPVVSKRSLLFLG